MSGCEGFDECRDVPEYRCRECDKRLCAGCALIVGGYIVGVVDRESDEVICHVCDLGYARCEGCTCVLNEDNESPSPNQCWECHFEIDK